MKLPSMIAMSHRAHTQFPVAACIFDSTSRPKNSTLTAKTFKSQLNTLMAFLFMHSNSFSHILFSIQHLRRPVSSTHTHTYTHIILLCAMIIPLFLELIVFICLHLTLDRWQFHSLDVLMAMYLLRLTNWFWWNYVHDIPFIICCWLSVA